MQLTFHIHYFRKRQRITAGKCKVDQILRLFIYSLNKHLSKSGPDLRQVWLPFASVGIGLASTLTCTVTLDPSLPSLATVSSSFKWEECLRSLSALTLLDVSTGV